jgi:hypothetical protein
MTDYLNPNRIYPDCPLRRIDNPPGFDSIRQGSEEKGEHRMTDTRDYIVFDRTGTPHVVVPVKVEIGGNYPQNGNREVDLQRGVGKV